jgi:hypothetical protein
LKWDTNAPQQYRESTESDECREWLEDILKEHSLGLRPKEIEKKGVELGFSRSMIHRVRRKLAGHIRNTHGRQAPDNAWMWSDQSLSADEIAEDQD